MNKIKVQIVEVKLLMDVLLISSSLFQPLWMRLPPVPLAPQNHRQDSVAPHRYLQCLTSLLQWTVTFITDFYMQDPPSMDFHLTIILMHSTQLLLRSLVMPGRQLNTWRQYVKMSHKWSAESWRYESDQENPTDNTDNISHDKGLFFFVFANCLGQGFPDFNLLSDPNPIICFFDHFQ